MSDLYDIKGIPLRHGDLIRIPHFRGRRRIQVYLWKMVIEEGGKFFAIDIQNSFKKQSWDKAYRTLLFPFDQFQIVDSPLHYETKSMWYERPRRKK